MNHRLLAILAVVALTTIALLATLGNGGARQPTAATSTTAPAATLSASTTTIVQPSAVTGRGPESFTTLRAPGPVQVTVTHLACVRYAGDGWRISYRIANQDTERTGAVLAQVDDAEAVVLASSLTLRAGQSMEATQTVIGAGEAVVVTWANSSRPVASFPLELPFCPVDPADERAARQATTTGATP